MIWYTKKCATCDNWVLSQNPKAVCHECYWDKESAYNKLTEAGFKVERMRK